MTGSALPTLLTPDEIEESLEKLARSGEMLRYLVDQWLNDRLNAARDVQAFFEVRLLKPKSHGLQDIASLDTSSQAILRYKDKHGFELFGKSVGKLTVPGKIKVPTSNLLNRVAGAARLIHQCLDAAHLISEPVRQWATTTAEMKSFEKGKLESLFRALSFYSEMVELREQSSGSINRPAREIDIEGFDTKFLESNLSRLERIYQADTDRVNSGLAFEAYFGLVDKTRRVRMRCLDKAWAKSQGAHFFDDGDIEVEAATAARELNVVGYETIYIVENLLSYEKLPDSSKGLAIWGKGAGILGFADALPLRKGRVVYWGDLDYAGFQILSNLRTLAPHAQSMLMDIETLQAYYGKPVEDPSYKTAGDKQWITRLTQPEQEAFSSLKGKRVEQEFLVDLMNAYFGTTKDCSPFQKRPENG